MRSGTNRLDRARRVWYGWRLTFPIRFSPTEDNVFGYFKKREFRKELEKALS